jgi:hypothetical protein
MATVPFNIKRAASTKIIDKTLDPPKDVDLAAGKGRRREVSEFPQ